MPPAPLPSFPYDAPVPPASVGVDAERLARAVDLFRAQQARGLFPGGQLAVRRRGSLVASVAVGIARGARGEEAPVPVTATTRFNVHSASKPLVGLCIARLEEAGAVALEAPVARYVPEFAANGKGAITLLDVLTHRGGVLLPEFIASPERWADPEAVLRALVDAVPSYPRGTLAYHPNEFGWILAEVVRRVAGEPLDVFCSRELLAPAGLGEMAFRGQAAWRGQVARTYWVGRRTQRLNGVDLAAQLETTFHAEPAFSALVPGASLWTDAVHLAGLYEVLVAGGVTREGRRWLREETVRAYTTRAVFGLDRGNRVPMSVGRGFLVGSPWPSFYGGWGTSGCFGHAGALDTLAFGDHATGLAAAIVTNGNGGNMDFLRRFRPLVTALRRACRP
jgi:CubicO group peptidase (beta-lactamase class C family)